jgi:chromosome segregation ATPase
MVVVSRAGAGMNERFDRIDSRLDRLEAGQDDLRSDVKNLQAGQDSLRSDVRELRADHGTLRTDLEDLGRHMRVLHEEVLDRIRAIPEYSGPTRAEFAELKEMLGRRLDPLEATVRQHSAEIEHLKQQRN